MPFTPNAVAPIPFPRLRHLITGGAYGQGNSDDRCGLPVDQAASGLPMPDASDLTLLT